MHRVLEHIDRHLDQTLDLETLARVAHFSPFHFHRLFSAWMGEPLGAYLRRRRLETAATRLSSQPRVPVLGIAVGVGFGSGEAFARAFKAQFGLAPTAWRQMARANRKLGQTDSKRDQDALRDAPHRSSTHSTEDAMQAKPMQKVMQVTLIDRAPTFVAYLRHIGPYGEPLSRFWQETVYPWMVTNGLVGATRYGVSHDDPMVTDPAKCRYDACVEVPEDFSGTGDYGTTTIPGGRYASAKFSGTTSEIGAAWDSLLRDWLPSSRMQLDGRPFFEFYPRDARYDPKTGVFECQLCIPVVPL